MASNIYAVILKIHGSLFGNMPNVCMMVSKMSGEQITLGEWSLTDHAPRAKMFQNQGVVQERLHIVFLHCLTKSLIEGV